MEVTAMTWRPVVVAAIIVVLAPRIVTAQEYIRVPERQTHTDVKADSSSGSIVLVLIPSGTTLPIVGREGEWLQVKLSPELRHTGIPMRWYKNEQVGFVHESTVDVVKGSPPPAAPLIAEPRPSQPPREYVRVPPRQTNTDIKSEPNSTSLVLLLVPAGTTLPVVGRRGEWIEIELSPELRRVGTVMRWYKNERTGFVHESTVELFTR
jgi:hypothetical protein